MIPLDHERRWYRYHHLFADVLRQRLLRESPDVVFELHRRAGVWFERQGLMSEAARHALAAGRWEHAADLIEGHGLPVILGGQVRTVLGWIDALPDALVRSRSVLCVVHRRRSFSPTRLMQLRHASNTPKNWSGTIPQRICRVSC